MKNGFNFKNRHSSDFGIVFKTKSRPILPEVKSYMFDVPLADGSYDFTDVNIDGREHYNDRVFEIIMQINADSLNELERKCAKISQWLMGKGVLSFDSIPSVIWKGRFISEVTFAPEIKGKKAILSAIFKAEPIGMASFDTNSGLKLSDCVELNSMLQLDLGNVFNYKLNHGANSITVNNIGDFYVRPTFRFDNSASNITLSYMDKRIVLENLESDVIIDLENCVITNSNGDNLMPNMMGMFFEIPSGKSEISVYTDSKCELQIEYIPRTIYCFDFSDIDWGECCA